MKFLVLGDSGMLGHLCGLYLAEAGHEVVGASRRGQSLFPSVPFHVGDEEGLRSLLHDGAFDVVLNCIAITSDHFRAPDELVVDVNARFPHRLARQCREMPTRVFQVSTDGVFSGEHAPYDDAAAPDAAGLYGRSKAEGELHDGKNLTIRACPFGPDINADGVGLFNWFMHAQAPVQGWTRALFTGVTTLAFARFVEQAAIDGLTGLVQFASAEPLSKAALLHQLDERFRAGRSAQVHDVPGTAIDRSLVPSAWLPYATAPSYERMLDDLKAWMERHPQAYGEVYGVCAGTGAGAREGEGADASAGARAGMGVREGAREDGGIGICAGEVS